MMDPVSAFRVFVSYRREDSAGHAGRVADHLVGHFGSDNVFMDVDAIELGLDFREVIREAVGSCDVFIVVMGKEWLTSVDAKGSPRLRDTNDYVRLEVETALDRGVRVIPALVEGATMPSSDELPDSLAALTFRNAIVLRDDNFRADMKKLIDALEQLERRKTGGLREDVSPALESPAGPASSPAETVEPVTERARLARRKLVSVVFADLVDFTGLGESRDHEAVSAAVAHYFDEMNQVVTSHGGTVQKYIGDGVMAVFGEPVVREDDALRAVLAAYEMRRRLTELNPELESRWGIRLQVRIGVNTGETVTDLDPRQQPLLAADCVNVAARLQQAAEPGEILIGEGTWRQVRRHIKADAVGPLKLKGKREPQKAFRLNEVVTSSPTRVETSFEIVGRARELGLLNQWFENVVRTAVCRLVTILGEAGMGKSRLASELQARIADRATFMFGRCLSYGDGNTFWPLGEAIKTGAGITRTDSPEEGLEKLASLAGDQQREVVQRVATAIGFGTRPAGLDETFWAARAFFEGIAAHQPLVLIFDDLQWAEPAFLDLLDYLATCSSGHPILIVCLSRPELLEVRPDWGATDERRAHLRLTSLAPDESNQLIRRLLGAAELAATEVEWIATASGGNPLFLETLVEMLVEERRLEIRDGRWEPSATVPSPLPATVDALLAARLDGLDATSQTVLNCASVLGYTFARPRLAALTPDISPGDLDNILAELVEGDFIRHDETKRGDEDALRFAHILLRDAVYNSILKGERADLHLRVARELERRAGERGVELQELLGYHLECAYRHLESLRPVNDNDRAIGRNASGWLSAAGRRALAGGDMQAAVRLLERALALLPGDDAARSDLLLRLSIAYAEMGEAAQADALVSERIMAEHRGRPFLAYRDDKGRQRVVDLDERDSRVTVGRRSDNDISIPWDGEVSRLHAVLDRGRFGWTVTDDGMSRNGSFVNGSSVSGSKSLEDGDVLRFGDTIILYRAPTTTTVQPEIGGTRATTFVSLSLLPMLTDGERKLLEALCQSWDLASGRSEERAIRVTTDLGLEQQEVREVLHVLFAKLHVEQATPAQELAQLVGRARSLGLATEPVGRDN